MTKSTTPVHYGKFVKNPEETMQHEMRAWELRARGFTQYEIAAELGVGQGTVSKMLKKARTHYHKYFVKNIQQVQDENIALCNRIISDAMRAWYSSVSNPDMESNPHGNPQFLHAALKGSERLAKALGTDAPTRTENKNENKNELKVVEFSLDIPNANQLDSVAIEIDSEGSPINVEAK
jgi:transcriptional regulator with XRE-family HTH domain